MANPTRFTRRMLASRLAAAAGALPVSVGSAAAESGAPSAFGSEIRRGVWQTTHNSRALVSPGDVPAGETWRYMLTYPFQVAPRLAALVLNIKVTPGPGQDFPVGVDLLLFDDVRQLHPEKAMVLARNHTEPNPNAGGKTAIMAKFIGQVGFVPLGAKGTDGRPHRHAGTGFAQLSASARPVDDSEGLDNFPDRVGRGAFRGARAYGFLEIRQLAYDGRVLNISPPRRWAASETIDGHQVVNQGMSAAIPDGDDLLLPIAARQPGRPKGVSGVCRWRRSAGTWQPIAFTAITPDDDSIEPSLVRDLDGSLLFLARGRRNSGPPVRIWRQRAGASRWELILNRQRLTNSTPVTLNSAVDGTPYVLMNLYQPEFRLPAGVHSDGGISRLEPKGWRGERSTICLWALNERRDDFATPLIVRDPLVDHGVPPKGTIWAADHATATTVMLRDGRWHSVFGYRMLEWIENTHQTPPSPQTGCYLDEAISLGPPFPPWRF
jgi:hypothetical protein